MAEPLVPKRRPPRKKLKMPLFGNMFGGKPSDTYKEDPIFSNKWVIRGFLLMLAASFILPYYFPTFFGGRKVYSSKSDLMSIELNGIIRKKYYDSNNPNKIHRILVVVNKDGSKPMLDFYRNDSAFFEQVAVPFPIVKKAGSLDVRIGRFIKPDTVITLQVD